jgi:RimJ/RimL family protein N-acetyltransferase
VEGGRRRSRDLLIALKESALGDERALSVPVGMPVRALLRPLATRPDAMNADDVARLTQWRNRFVTAFLTEFDADDERTATWLAETVRRDDTRVIFMVDDLEGRTVGYMGLAAIDWHSGYFEADSIVRGETAPRGLMGESLQTLMRWAMTQLGLGAPWVRVRSDNPAVQFYERIGFVEQHRVPLRRREEPGMVTWTEDESADSEAGPTLVHMRWESPA